nr:immunoglobulin light chain junction region [Macaca mulatta]
CQQYSSDPRTF